MIEGYRIIGQTLGTFGFRGGLRIKIEEAYQDSFDRCEHVFLDDSPSPLPFFKKRVDKKDGLILLLDELPSKEVAIEWTMKDILLRDEDLQEGEKEKSPLVDGVEELIGCMLINHGIEVGTILRIEHFPEQIMAILSINNIERMIPLHPNLIISIDTENKILEMDLPEGLLEI